jgi:hypothetical protein
VLYETKDPGHVAALMQSVLEDDERVELILAAQDQALARLQARDFDGTLLRFVRQVLAAPRRPQPTVAYDFWRQFALAQQLEEIRQYRPAAFQALPPEEDAGPVAELGHRA